MDFLKKALDIGDNVKDFLTTAKANFKAAGDNLKFAYNDTKKRLSAAPGKEITNALTTFANELPRVRQFEQPRINQLPAPAKFAANFFLNSGQASAQGYKNTSQGLYNLVNDVKRVTNTKQYTPSNRNAFNTLQSGAQLVKGVGQSIVPFTGFFQGANAVASRSKPDPKIVSPVPGGDVPAPDRLRRLAAGIMRGMSLDEAAAPNVESQKNFNLFGTKVDPLELVGNMVGFVQNPVNKQLFGKTELFNPSIVNNKVANFILTRGARGMAEDVLLSLPDLPTNDRKEVLKFLGTQAVFGAISEITVNGALEAPGAFIRKMRQSLNGADKQAFEGAVEAAEKTLKNSAGRLYDTKTGKFVKKAAEELLPASGGGYLSPGKLSGFDDQGKAIRLDDAGNRIGVDELGNINKIAATVNEKWNNYVVNKLPEKVFRANDSTNGKAVIGRGTYVSELLDGVKRYGKQISEFEIQPGTKLLDLTEPRVLQEFTDEAIQKYPKLFDDTMKSDTSDQAIGAVMTQYAKELGFDGIKADPKNFGTVVFDGAKLKPFESVNDLPSLNGVKQGIDEVRPDVEALPAIRALGEDAGEKGWKDIRGQIVKSPEDLAETIKDFRNPKAEAFHVIYLDDQGKVLAHTALSNNDVSGVAISKQELLYKIGDRADRLNADSFYVAHNHPTGEVTASDGDKLVTNGLIDRFGDRFKGHVIMDHDKISFLSPDQLGGNLGVGLKAEVKDIDLGKSYKSDAAPIGSPDDAFKLIDTHYQIKPDKMGIVVLNSRNQPVALKEVTLRQTNPEEINAVVRQAVRENGGNKAILAMDLDGYKGGIAGVNALDIIFKVGDRLETIKGSGFDRLGDPEIAKKYTSVSDRLFDKPESKGLVNFYGEDAGKVSLPEQVNKAPLDQGSTGGGKIPPGQEPPQGVKPNDVEAKGSSYLQNISSKLNRLYTRTIDRFHPLTELAKQAGDEELQKMDWALAGYYGAGSTANYHVNYELKDIISNVDVDNLRTAAVAMRDIELAGRGIRGSNINDVLKDLPATGKVSGMDEQAAAAVQRLNDLKATIGEDGMKELGDSLNKLYEYQDNLVKEYLVKTGVMSQKQFNAMKQNNQFYVPYRRVMDNVDDFLGFTPQTRSAGSVASQNVIKGIKGSEKAIEDPIESIVENTYKILNVARRQEVAQNIIGLQEKLPPGMIKEIKGKVGQTPHISMFDNGKVKHYTAPADVIESAKGMREETMNNVVKALSIPTAWFRATATGANPEFLVPNVFRDLQNAFVNIGLNPLAFARGLGHMMKEDETWQQFLKSGAQTSRVSLDRPYLKQTVGDISKQGLEVKNAKDVLRVLQTLGEYSEQPTRIAVWEKAYKKAVESGLDETSAMRAAAKASQDTTTNFARRGADTKSFNAIYAFVNARAQGTDKLVRSFKEDPAGVGMRLGIMTLAPTIAAYIHNNRFEGYNDERVVSDRDKRDNFIFMLSDKPIEALGGIQYLKIPKGDVGKLGNPVEAFLDYVLAKGGSVGETLVDTLLAFSPIDSTSGIIPTALRPPLEVAYNKDLYTGYDLVPDYKRNFPAGFQDNEYTSPLFRMLGQKLNISPAKMQQLAQGYGTGWVRIAEMLTSKLVPEIYHTEKNDQTAPINTTPIARRFFGGARRSEEAQLEVEKNRARSLKTQISTIRNAIKRGEIPQEAGFRQIEKLQNEASQRSSAPSGELDALARVYEVDQYTTPSALTGIDKFEYEKEKASAAVKLWTGSGEYASFPEEQKLAMIKEMGYEEPQIKYAGLADRDTEVKAQYIAEEAQNMTHKELIDTLVQGRLPSITGDMLASNGVIDDLYEAGLISKSERTWLKKIKLNEDGSYKQGSAGTGGSGGGGLTKTELKKLQSEIKKLADGIATPPKLDKIFAKIDTTAPANDFSGFFQAAKTGDVSPTFSTKIPQVRGTQLPTSFYGSRPRITGVSPEAAKAVAAVRGRASGVSTPTKLSQSFYRG